MQHPDQGMIHTWLDGELSADEASAFEAHIAGCPECSAKVAEARGLAAASSRIVSALDIVPSGVIPISVPAKRRWYATAQFRAAAALAIVAGGSFLVMRDRDETAMDRIMTTASSPAPEAATRADEAPRDLSVAPKKAPVATQSERAAVPKKTESTRIAEGPMPLAPPAAPLSAPGNAVTTLSGRVSGVQTGVADMRRESDSVTARRRAPVEQEFSGKGVKGGVARGVERGFAPVPEFRRIRTDSTQSGSWTVFELSPGVEVTLTDAAPVAADAQLKQKEIAASAPAPPAMAAAAKADTAQAATPVNTITWVDKRGHTMTLTGRVSVLQLQVVRQSLPEDRR
jgi:hypothetical protein